MKTNILLLIAGLLFWAAAPANAQQSFRTRSNTSKKALRSFENGIVFSHRGELTKARDAFAAAFAADSLFVDAYYEWAQVQNKLNHFAGASAGFQKVLALAPDYHPNLLLNLAMSKWEEDKFEEAATFSEAFLAKKPTSEKMTKIARRLAENARFAAQAVRTPVPFEPINLGTGVNTQADEYLPSLTADGEILIFTRLDGGYNENFYLSQLDTAQKVWRTAQPLTEINTFENEGAHAISADGSWLVFTACNRRNDGSQGSCDLYWSQQKKGNWTKPQPFSATINTKSWDAQPCISADGKTLIFSSERPGGLGGKDLWMAQRGPDGKWAPPQNLGNNINTSEHEQCPFLHPDGQTLYFTSDGHPGMGNNDLYRSRRQADGTWSKPENLGYPINTKAQEGTLVVSLDGRKAYFAANRPGGQGKNDLYVFDLPAALRPLPVTYVKARVLDANTRFPLTAKVEFVDLQSGATFVESNTKSDGTFLVCLPLGKNYALNVSKKDYLFATENFSLADNFDNSKTFLLEILLQSVENQKVENPETQPPTRQPVILKNVFFASGKAELLPESEVELNRLVQLLLENPTLRIQINGHTDSDGDEKFNQQLSELRARTVYQYLLAKNIAPERLKYRGFGESKPIADNATAEGKAKNRRTEFEVW